MRILVTGGAGFIGSHIVDHYLAENHEVAIVDNLWVEGGGKGGNINPAARFYQADITDEDALSRIFDEFKPEIVNHHAAQHSVSISTKNPQLDARVNILGLLNVLTQSKRVEARKIIFASSGLPMVLQYAYPSMKILPNGPNHPMALQK
ncbi:hypothetical protein KDK_35010 [Dictyobacter kobayashii]|uniref:NAD-dependent epimerase/dehydratase domain-containing protein n=1 Tax=Dictyobacter kobayashii TaxID=2014872 RepID=A0A402AKQ7_9CHLR|nr:NAD-dependent epimerase/dehydratase family protein [Dictyobacter kobayashii]GCE19701.1 hypothetical protein KDK_35010 [Dictyobacter kobayashii]